MKPPHTCSISGHVGNGLPQPTPAVMGLFKKIACMELRLGQYWPIERPSYWCSERLPMECTFVINAIIRDVFGQITFLKAPA